MIQAQELTRRYGDYLAVDRVSFEVGEGEIVGILGPNGAGKTTTIRMITGFLPPTRGRVTIYGKDLFAEPAQARRDIGYLPENVALYPEMRVSEYLAYRGHLEGLPRAEARLRIGEAVERCLLSEVREQIISTLSKGYRQRVGLAAAILHGPRVLVLDEPTVGLDPKQIIAIRELIRELGRRHTLLLSTHILPEVELLCGRVLIIDRGRIVAEGTPERLRERWLGNAVMKVVLKGQPAGAAETLAAVPGVVGVRGEAPEGATESVLHLECDRSADVREPVFQAAVEKGWVLLGLGEEKASLEDVFVRLTTHDRAAEAAESAAANAEVVQ
jgi:ABC-2 type transport system ATP-binding protein